MIPVLKSPGSGTLPGQLWSSTGGGQVLPGSRQVTIACFSCANIFLYLPFLFLTRICVSRHLITAHRVASQSPMLYGYDVWSEPTLVNWYASISRSCCSLRHVTRHTCRFASWLVLFFAKQQHKLAPPIVLMGQGLVQRPAGCTVLLLQCVNLPLYVLAAEEVLYNKYIIICADFNIFQQCSQASTGTEHWKI
jgi:hypothetical protein